MGQHDAPITGKEVFFDENRFIVSKTDTKGIITYVNDIFLEIAGYTEDEVMGKPHNIIRHPWMPKCVFKLLWDTLGNGDEIFAYVVNRTKSGDHYWVLAHATPTFDAQGNVTGYHSNRRVPERHQIEIIESLYKQLLAEEQKYATPKEGTEASFNMLLDTLKSKGVSYDEFALTL